MAGELRTPGSWFSKAPADEDEISEDYSIDIVMKGGVGREDREGGDAAHFTIMRQAPEVKELKKDRVSKKRNEGPRNNNDLAGDVRSDETSSFSGPNPNDF